MRQPHRSAYAVW